MIVEVDVAAFEQLIDPDEQLACIGSGYQFTEGPVWSPRDQSLYFSDIPSDKRWRWSERDGMTLDGSPTFKANGLALDAAGNLLACEQVSSCVVRLDARRHRELLAFHHRGKYLNSPNDIVVRRDGTIYFTDPDYGRWNDWIGQERSRERDFRGVYRIAAEPDPAGEAELIVAEHEFDQPNGLCFSPDETILYVNDSPRAEIKAFTVADDGTLSHGRVLIDGVGHGFREGDSEELKRAQHQEHHDQGALDGMKCDEYGNVWVTGPGGVWVISPAGERLGLIRTPEVVGNLTWGGDDLRTLFLMTTSTVHTVRTLVAPAPLVQHP